MNTNVGSEDTSSNHTCPSGIFTGDIVNCQGKTTNLKKKITLSIICDYKFQKTNIEDTHCLLLNVYIPKSR